MRATPTVRPQPLPAGARLRLMHREEACPRFDSGRGSRSRLHTQPLPAAARLPFVGYAHASFTGIATHTPPQVLFPASALLPLIASPGRGLAQTSISNHYLQPHASHFSVIPTPPLVNIACCRVPPTLLYFQVGPMSTLSLRQGLLSTPLKEAIACRRTPSVCCTFRRVHDLDSAS